MHESERIGKFLPLMQSLYNAARENMGFEPHVKICIIKSDKNMQNPLGKTAHYSPSEHKIALYTQGRHIKDILRSLAHELVHHNQNCRGDFDMMGETGEGYAQEDGHLREMEREAYEHGNMIFRDWEDNLKKKGARPLFTSTSQYVPPMTSDVVGGRMLEGNKMKNKVNESQLRSMVRSIIEEMFDEDGGEKLTEDSEELEEGTTKGKFDKTKKKATAADEKGKIGGKVLEEDKEELKEDSQDKETEDYITNKDADEREEMKLEDHIEAMEDHLGAIKKDIGFDDSKERADENLKESFFPKDRSIRSKARVELNEALMKRWKKIIK